MPGARKPRGPVGGALPTFMRVAVARIIEPAIPARVQMDDNRMAELIESMRSIGQIEPITLEQHNSTFELITGHRRYLAARSLGWSQLSALVWQEGKASKLAMMLHENTMRESLNPAEEAIFMAQAQEQLKLDEAGLMKTFHRGADYIASRLQLLRGDPDIFLALQQGEIRIGVAHELNRITDVSMRRYYLDCAKRTDPPARVVHGWVGDWKIQHDAQEAAVAAGLAVPAGTLGVASSTGAVPSGGVGAGAVPDAAPALFFGCELCGGDRDPHNLLTVRIHKWEWERIMESVDKAARGTEFK